MNEEFFTVAEVAERLRCDEASIYRLIREKKITHVKPGHNYLIAKSHLKEFLDSRTIQAKTEESKVNAN